MTPHPARRARVIAGGAAAGSALALAGGLAVFASAPTQPASVSTAGTPAPTDPTIRPSTTTTAVPTARRSSSSSSTTSTTRPRAATPASPSYGSASPQPFAPRQYRSQAS